MVLTKMVMKTILNDPTGEELIKLGQQIGETAATSLLKEGLVTDYDSHPDQRSRVCLDVDENLGPQRAVGTIVSEVRSILKDERRKLMTSSADGAFLVEAYDFWAPNATKPSRGLCFTFYSKSAD